MTINQDRQKARIFGQNFLNFVYPFRSFQQKSCLGARTQARTGDLSLFRGALYQLSYPSSAPLVIPKKWLFCNLSKVVFELIEKAIELLFVAAK